MVPEVDLASDGFDAGAGGAAADAHGLEFLASLVVKGARELGIGGGAHNKADARLGSGGFCSSTTSGLGMGGKECQKCNGDQRNNFASHDKRARFAS